MWFNHSLLQSNRPNCAYQAQSWTRPSNGGAQEQSANVGRHGSKEEGQHRIGRSKMDNFF